MDGQRRIVDPMRNMPPEFVQCVDEVCLMHNINPIAAALFLKFRDTPDGRRFMAGGRLTPQFNPPRRTQAQTKPMTMTLDWLEGEWK